LYWPLRNSRPSTAPLLSIALAMISLSPAASGRLFDHKLIAVYLRSNPVYLEAISLLQSDVNVPLTMVSPVDHSACYRIRNAYRYGRSLYRFIVTSDGL